jgi:hypothetical protein
MSTVESIERYLRTQLAADAKVPGEDEDRGVRAFITISRQAGTGGHALADAIVQAFERQPEPAFHGWVVYDRTVCDLVADDEAYERNLGSLLAEEYRSTAQDWFHQILHRTLDQDIVMQRVALVVRTLAGMGKSIIVGRGGANATDGMRGGLAVRMVAPMEHRVARSMRVDQYGNEHETTDRLRKNDRNRSRLIHSAYDADIDDPTRYDLVVNAGRVTHDQAAEAIVGLLRVRIGS